jgi:hypothetical protein
VTSNSFTATQSSYDFAFTPSMPGPNGDTATLIDDVQIELMP